MPTNPEFRTETCATCMFHGFVNSTEAEGAVPCRKRLHVVVMPQIRKQMVNLQMQQGVVPVPVSIYAQTNSDTPACGDYERLEVKQ